MNMNSSLETFAHSLLARAPARYDSEDRKARVIAAAMQACARDGPFLFKVTEVAEAATVSTATIYKDFVNSDDMLSQTILRSFEILAGDWPLKPNVDDCLPTDYSKVESFLAKFCETYRDPFSNWILRVDLATASTQGESVRLALIGFQNRMTEFGLATLPSCVFDICDPKDLIQILVGTIQLQIVGAMLDDIPNPGVQPKGEALDIPKAIKEMLAWLEVAPSPQGFIAAPSKTEAKRIPSQSNQIKSNVQVTVEALLATNFSRMDSKGRRKKMMAAAMQHCSITGIEDASVAQIAKLARVSTASVYREFPNKEALINASIFNFLPIYAQATMQAVDEIDPQVRLKKLLTAQALVLADPFGAWVFRYYLKLEAEQSADMKAVAKTARAQSDLFWNSQIRRLEQEGHLRPSNIETTRNMIFGGVHRRCVLARVLYKDDAYVWSEIQASVDAAVDLLFRLYGTAHGASPATRLDAMLEMSTAN